MVNPSEFNMSVHGYSKRTIHTRCFIDESFIRVLLSFNFEIDILLERRIEGDIPQLWLTEDWVGLLKLGSLFFPLEKFSILHITMTS